MAEKFKFEREIPVESGYDVLVAGGGPAGSAAAICAARLGAKVLLVEATGCLGGMGTSGLVCAFDPMADGEKPLVGGFMRELVETLYERKFTSDWAQPEFWRKDYHRWTPFRPEGLKLVLDEFAEAANVEVRFFTRLIDADVSEGTVKGAIIANVEGMRCIRAKAYIDATGDAVLSAACGAAYLQAGRDTANIMPATLPALFSGADWTRENLRAQTPETVAKIEAEYGAGNFIWCDRHFVGITPLAQKGGIGYLNGGHIFDLDSCSIASLSRGMMTGRKVVRTYENFLRKYSPSCRDAELMQSAELMGVRESRRVLGEYTLTHDDYLARRQFPDQIGVFNKFVDIHPYDDSRAEYDRLWADIHSPDRKLGPGECFGIPYGILVPKGFDNLWVAGRCVSSDVRAQGSIRVMPAAAMMGQAAGTAAVQCLEAGETASGIDTARLVETLRANGANLPQQVLSRTMTRSNDSK